MVDARLADGTRVNAIIPPLALVGPAMSLRRSATHAIDGDRPDSARRDPAGDDGFSPGRRPGCRVNFLISGGTGSGKTTLLNALSALHPADERVVTIEDAAELQLQQPARGPPGNAPGQHRGQGRGHPARPGEKLPAHAAGPHRHRRSAAAARPWTCSRP